MRKPTLFILPAVVLMLSACLTSNALPPKYYLLHPLEIEQADRKKVQASIIVEKPSVVSGLNTDRIALLKHNRRELDYFAQARWNGDLDSILQDFIIETLENSYDVVEVDTTGARQNADYVVVTKIRDFQAEYEGNTNSLPNLKVEIVVSVLKLPSLEPVTRIQKSAEQQASENSVTAVASGLEGLLQEMSRDILANINKMI